MSSTSQCKRKHTRIMKKLWNLTIVYIFLLWFFHSRSNSPTHQQNYISRQTRRISTLTLTVAAAAAAVVPEAKTTRRHVYEKKKRIRRERNYGYVMGNCIGTPSHCIRKGTVRVLVFSQSLTLFRFVSFVYFHFQFHFQLTTLSCILSACVVRLFFPAAAATLSSPPCLPIRWNASNSCSRILPCENKLTAWPCKSATETDWFSLFYTSWVNFSSCSDDC